MRTIYSIYVGAMGDLAYFDIINKAIGGDSSFFSVSSVELNSFSKKESIDESFDNEKDHISEDFYPLADIDADKSTMLNEKSPSIKTGAYSAAYQANRLTDLSVKNVATGKASEFLFKYLKDHPTINEKLAQLIVVNAKEGSGITDYDPAKYATFFLSVDAAVKYLLKGNNISEADRNYLQDDAEKMLDQLYKMGVYIASPMIFRLENRQAIIHYNYDIEDPRLQNAEKVLSDFGEFFDRFPEEKEKSRFFDVISTLFTSITYDGLN